MACEEAGPAPGIVQVSAGSTVSLQWAGATNDLQGKAGVGGSPSFPWVHAMGPIMDYIAPCGDAGCESFDASSAGWTKLAEFGIDNSQSISDGLRTTMANKPEKYYPEGQGLWAMAKFGKYMLSIMPLALF
jgi:lytic cellulose monooxygenase (C1-hydroxylating)